MGVRGLGPATVRLVSLAIADVVNDAHYNQFFGSRRYLAKKVDLDPSTVGDVINHLVGAGVLVVVKKKRGEIPIYQWIWGVGGPPTPSGSRLPHRVGADPHTYTKASSRDAASRRPKGGRAAPAQPQPLSLEELHEKYGVEI